MSAPDPGELRRLLCDHIRREAGPEIEPGTRVALLLSGGVDSLSVGFAARAVGFEVSAYTFQVGEWASEDARAARLASEKMGWRFTLVKCPVEDETLQADFLRLAREFRCAKKTTFECTWPFLYVVPRIEERLIVTGFTSDDHFGLSRSAMVHHRYPKEKFDAWREKKLRAEVRLDALNIERLARERGRRVLDPYFDPELTAYLRRFSWDELNKPRQKWIIPAAFAEDFRRTFVREHSNLQLNGGVARLFENLLRSPLNTKGRRRVMDLCRDYALAPADDENDDA